MARPKATKTKQDIKAEKTPCKFVLEIIINTQYTRREVPDLQSLKETIMSLKPDVVLTEMYITVTDDKFSFERRFNLVQTKRIFMSEEMLELLVLNNLIH